MPNSSEAEPKPARTRTTIGDCLDADTQTLVGTLPSMPNGRGGHKALLDVYFDLLAGFRPAVFCDIGANKGEAGRRARNVLPGAHVFGFEANPGIHARYADINTDDGVTWVNAAVADVDGSLELHIPRVLSRALDGDTLVSKRVREARDTGKSSLLKRDEDAEYETLTVRALTLDGYLGEHAPEGRVALWIDVEGAAHSVLKGGSATLARTDLVVLEVEGFGFWRDQSLALKVLNHLQAMGFVPVLRDREYNDAQFNVICLRDTPELADHQRRIGAAVTLQTNVAAPAVPRTQEPSPSSVPVFVPCFNNPSYCVSMLAQLQSLGFADITFVDNASDSPAMHEWLGRADSFGARVERLAENLGPRDSIFTPERLASLPRYFAVTDPDLRFNVALPGDFLSTMADAMMRHGKGKAGFALDIGNRQNLRQEKFKIGRKRYHIWDWERQFWSRRMDFTPGGDPVFEAIVDTTFALYDRKAFKVGQFLKALRLGGRFTATHLPWLAQSMLAADEAQTYLSSQKHSFYSA
jgi:FkbM family methyltransferase